MSIKVTFNSGFLSDILQRTKVADVTEAARTGMAAVSGKAGDTLAYAKLRRAVTDLEDEIDLQLCDIGRLIYATHCGTPTDSEEIQKILEYVDGLYEEIEGHERQMKLMRGARFCGVCGAENAAGNVYCQDCGQPFPEAECDPV